MLRTYVRDITRRRFMTARRYASAEYAVVERPSVCLSVRPPVRHKPVLYRNDWTNRAGFGMDASFHVCHTEIWASPKLGVLPSGTLYQTPNFPKYRHGKSIALSTKLVDDRAC